eukprot:scaffold16195_cov19-Tisochrysis_lutea.AAC.2
MPVSFSSDFTVAPGSAGICLKGRDLRAAPGSAGICLKGRDMRVVPGSAGTHFKSTSEHTILSAVDPPNLTYLLDIIEQGGEHMVRSAYWDCGDWSDLWQACRSAGSVQRSNQALLHVASVKWTHSSLDLRVRVCPHPSLISLMSCRPVCFCAPAVASS